MTKPKIKQQIKQPLFNQDSQKQSDNEDLGTAATRKDYITLKKNKVKPLTPNQQNQHSVELFRNDELYKYLVTIDKEDNNPKKKVKGKLVDPKEQVLQNVIFNLKLGWNVCLTGGMDKMDILDDVVNHLEKCGQNIFIIRGYAQPLNEKKIFNQFGTHLINSGFVKTIDNVLIKDQLSQYKKALDETPEDTIIYIMFYDISNYGFLSSQLQSRLATLLSLPKLRVITSIENCKIVLNWSLNIIEMLNFIYVSCNSTCIPTTKLLKYLPLPNEKAQKTQLQISQIWKSLNRNQRQIAVILAENQLVNINSPTSQENYFSFQELLDACIDKIILSDDHQLRENLIELIDHRVIIEEIDKTKNKKVFIMKLDRRILENMIQGKYDNYDFENGT